MRYGTSHWDQTDPLVNASHADRQVAKRAEGDWMKQIGEVGFACYIRPVRMKMRPAYSLSDALNQAEIDRERKPQQVLSMDLEEGDFPRVKFMDTGAGEREPE